MRFFCTMSFVVCLLVSFLCGCLPLMVVCLIMHPFSFAYIPHTPILIHKQYRLFFSFTNNTDSSSHSQTAQTLLLIHKQHILLLSFTDNTYSYFHSLTTRTLHFCRQSQSTLTLPSNQHTHSIAINTHSITTHTTTIPKRVISRKQTPIPAIGVSSSEKRQNND